MENLTEQIPFIRGCKKIIQINKGFSSDEKYLIHMHGEIEKLFLRTFQLEQYDSKKIEFAILEKMQDYEVACSRPIAIGKTGEKGYMITTYIEGYDAEDEISAFTMQEQFNLGLESGKELRKMHQHVAPEHIDSWYARKVEKHKKYIKTYLTCGIKIENDQQIMSFIEENIYLMKQRPNLF